MKNPSKKNDLFFKLLFAIKKTDPLLIDRFKRFESIDNQTRFALDEAALQKRYWSLKLAQNCRFERGLDLFAGVGYSGHIYSSCCEKVVAIESDKAAFECLERNLGIHSNVELIHGDNLDFLAGYSGPKFQLVDVDPFGTPHMQLEHLDKIFDAGVVAITSGSIMAVSRGLVNSAAHIPGGDLKKYRGINAVTWAKSVYLPFLCETYRLRLEAFYLYPSSLRAIFTRDYFLPPGCFPGETHLGWFRGVKYLTFISRARTGC